MLIPRTLPSRTPDCRPPPRDRRTNHPSATATASASATATIPGQSTSNLPASDKTCLSPALWCIFLKDTLAATHEAVLPMQLASLTSPDLVFPRVTGADRSSVLRFFAERIAKHESLDSDELLSSLEEREELGSTGIGGGVAIPHCRLPGIREALLSVGIASPGVPFGATDDQPVQLFFVIVTPSSEPQQNLRLLAAISRWVKVDGNVGQMLELPSVPAMIELLAQASGESSR